MAHTRTHSGARGVGRGAIYTGSLESGCNGTQASHREAFTILFTEIKSLGILLGQDFMNSAVDIYSTLTARSLDLQLNEVTVLAQLDL